MHAPSGPQDESGPGERAPPSPTRGEPGPGEPALAPRTPDDDLPQPARPAPD
jgi:hypothetical protein